MVLIFFIGCMAFFVGAIVTVQMMGRRQASASGARLLRQVAHVHAAEVSAKREAASGGAIALMGGGLRQNISMFRSPRFQLRLLRAGYSSSKALDTYSLIRVLAPTLAMLLGACVPVARVFWMFFLPLLFFFLPELALSRMIKKRASRIARSLPDVIDLLVICVEAGLGLDQATARVAEELALSHPDVSDELVRLGQEQRAGKPRLEAWKDMSERLKIDDLDAFVAMIVQAERFGTPIARALSTFAANARTQRTQQAEEKAAKTTIKITFPLVLFIFPCIFIVLLGPAVLSMMHHLGDMVK